MMFSQQSSKSAEIPSKMCGFVGCLKEEIILNVPSVRSSEAWNDGAHTLKAARRSPVTSAAFSDLDSKPKEHQSAF